MIRRRSARVMQTMGNVEYIPLPALDNLVRIGRLKTEPLALRGLTAR